MFTNLSPKYRNDQPINQIISGMEIISRKSLKHLRTNADVFVQDESLHIKKKKKISKTNYLWILVVKFVYS